MKTDNALNTRERLAALSLQDPRPVLLWYVTGTFHGSHVYARSEGDARRAFHAIHRQPVPCTASGVGATRAQCDTLLAH